MTTSRVPDVVGWLVDTFTAAATVGGATPPVSVFCGPALTGDFAKLALFVGVDDPDLLEQGQPLIAATSDQTWPAYGTQVRDENLTVNCVAEAWSGDTDTRAAMTAVYGIVAAVETLLRADVTMGGLVMTSSSTGEGFRWRQGPGGICAYVPLRVEAQAAIDT